jgi:predicted RNase H-like HicB family nuclease
VEPLKLTGIVVWDEETHKYASLRPELDVASMGRTVEDAKEMLLEAATLHIEVAIEDGLPYLRQMPAGDDPRNMSPGEVVEVFELGPVAALMSS